MSGTPEQDVPVTFTRFRSSAGIVLTKRYKIVDNKIRKTPAAKMYQGEAERITIDFPAFGRLLDAADERTAFGYGTHDPARGDKVRIVKKGEEKDDAIARSKDHYAYRPGPGIVMHDHDPCPRGASLTPKELDAVLAGIIPGYDQAARWVRGSLSAGVHFPGEHPKAGGGFHLWNPVLDASDIPRFGKVLHARLWFAKHGYIKFSERGALLSRTILDGAVYSPERLDFVGRPIVEDGLVWAPPEAIYRPGGCLDTRRLPDLTEDEERRYEALVAKAKEQARQDPERATIIARWQGRQLKLMLDQGVTEEKAREALDRIDPDDDRAELPLEFVLEFDDGSTVTVEEVVTHPDKYREKTMPDPFAGPEYGRGKAKIFANPDGTTMIHSYAHGGITYFLPHSPVAVAESLQAGTTTDGPDDDKPLNLADVILTDSQLIGLSIPEKRCYLTPWLTEGAIISMVAWRGVGKSLFSWGAIDAITKGRSFGPWQCGDPVNCLILDGEMAVQDGRKRISDFGTADRKAELLFYSDHYAHGCGTPRANLLSAKWRKAMTDHLLENNIKVWVCDNLASLAPGIDENSKADWDTVNQWLLTLRFLGITTILIHHEGKSGTQRGTSAREDNLDICIALKRPKDYSADQGARFVVTFTKSRVPQEYLPLIADHEFQFVKATGGVCEWVWNRPQAEKKTEILRLSDEGMGVNEIAETLGIAKSYVSKIRTAAINNGMLSKNGRFTQCGFENLNAQIGEHFSDEKTTAGEQEELVNTW